MLRLIEIILSLCFPTYWEITVIRASGETICSHFPKKIDAENYAEFVMAGDTGEVSYVCMDKFINARPSMLIKVNRYHKGWSNKL